MKKILFALMIWIITVTAITTAATLNVEKRTPNGSTSLGPFALTVSCTDLSVFNFSLEGGESSTFFFADATPIDCTISETMTLDQAEAFTSTIGDTYGTDDGQISALDAALVDGQTFYVTNILKGGGKASSIGGASIISSIPTDSSSSEKNSSSTSETNTPQVSVSVDLADPYTCGGEFIGQVSSDDIPNTTVTIDLQQAGKSVKVLTPALDPNGFYIQSINYTNLLSPTYVAAGSYAVIVTATYNGMTDSVSFNADITNQCDQMNYLDMLRERNASIIDAQKNNNNESTVKKPVAPTKLPNTGAEVL